MTSFVSHCGTKCWINKEPTKQEAPEIPRTNQFIEYLTTIPEWKRELLEDFKCMDSSGGEYLATYVSELSKDSGLVRASDGRLRKIQR